MPFLLFSILVWAGAGFFGGFFGPIYFNPEANQGPLLGIFITGPLGAVIGLVLGLILPRVCQRTTSNIITLAGAGAALTIILVFCLPDPKRIGTLYQGQITAEIPAAEMVSRAVREWEIKSTQYDYYHPRPNWQREMTEAVRQAGGRVITFAPDKVWTIYQLRKPWNAGRYERRPERVDGPVRSWVPATVVTPSAGLLYTTLISPGEAWPPREISLFLGVREAAAPPAGLNVK